MKKLRVLSMEGATALLGASLLFPGCMCVYVSAIAFTGSFSSWPIFAGIRLLTIPSIFWGIILGILVDTKNLRSPSLFVCISLFLISIFLLYSTHLIIIDETAHRRQGSMTGIYSCLVFWVHGFFSGFTAFTFTLRLILRNTSLKHSHGFGHLDD